MKIIKFLIIILLLTAFKVGSSANTRVVIVTNVDNTCECSLEFIRKLYLGRVTRYRDGRLAAPIIYLDDPVMQAKFYDLVLHSSAPRLRKHWSKLEFSGRGSRPETIKDAEELLNKLDSNTGYIGFVNAKDIDEKKYRILHEL